MARKILYLSKTSISGPGSRYRIYQYRDFFEKRGIKLKISPAFSEGYIRAEAMDGPGRLLLKSIEGLKAFIRRVWAFAQIYSFDLVAIEREYFPCFPPLFEILIKMVKGGYILEFDDAIFLSRGRRRKYPSTVRMASRVIAGNSHLASFAERFNPRVHLVPTCVDTDRYVKKEDYRTEGPATIGWIGLPFNYPHLLSILKPLKRLHQPGNVEIVLFSGRPPESEIPHRFVRWELEREPEILGGFDVGIMPLVDTPFARGKSGLKILQYMAAGVPVVASPVGVNAEIIRDGINGFLAASEDDWYEKVKALVEDRELREKLGGEGRKTVEKNYSLHLWGDRLVSIYTGDES